MLSVPNVTIESFKVEVSQIASGVRLSLSGTGDMVAVEPLRSCLRGVRSDMIRLGLAELEVDLHALYLLNSSCIKAFVTLIYSIQTDGPRANLRFLVNKHLSWQARTLTALVRMAPGIVSIAEASAAE